MILNRWPWKALWRGSLLPVGLIALLSGVVGFLLEPGSTLCESCNGPLRLLAAFIKTLQLFVLNVPTVELRHWTSWLAALLAPVATSGLAIAAFGARANRWRERMGLFLTPATDVFLGGGDTATGLADQRQRAGSPNCHKLVGLDISASAALNRAMEAFDVQPAFMHVGDALSRDALAAFQLHRTKNVWIATGDDHRNLEVARRALAEIHQHDWPSWRRWVSRYEKKLLNRPGENDKEVRVRVLVNVYDRRLTRARKELFGSDGQDRAALEFFSMPRLAARALLLQHPPQGAPGPRVPHLLIVGGGELAAALAVHAAQHLVYSEEPSRCVRISLVGSGSHALHDRLMRMFPALAAYSGDAALQPLLPLARIKVCECDETTFSLADWQRLQQWGGDFGALYVACQDDVLSAAAARRLAALAELSWGPPGARVSNPPIVACVQQPPGSLCAIHPDASGQPRLPDVQGLDWFDVFKECLREDEEYPGQTGDGAAMLVMMKYDNKLSLDTRLEDAKLAWHDDPDEFHWSNRLAADHMELKCQLQPGLAEAPLDDPSPELEQLCRLEHRRYVAERLLEGWLPTHAAQKNTPLRLNPTLVPFDSLPPGEMDKDKGIVQATPLIRKVLKGWKLQPQRSASARTSMPHTAR